MSDCKTQTLCAAKTVERLHGFTYLLRWLASYSTSTSGEREVQVSTRTTIIALASWHSRTTNGYGRDAHETAE
jgi:hypothetical protein